MLLVLGLGLLALFAYSLVDVITTPSCAVRGLPKPLWLFVVLLPLVGPLAWLLAGRVSRSSRSAASAPPRQAPDDDEEFLRDLRRRTEDQRRRARDPRDDDAG